MGFTQPQGGQEAAQLQPQQGPPALTFGLLGAGHGARGWEGRRGGSAGVSQGHRAKESRAEKGSQQGKNKTPQDENPNSPVSPTSAPCPGARRHGQRGRGTAGRQAGRKDAAIRPGLGHCQPAMQGWAGECSPRAGRDRGHRARVAWDTSAQSWGVGTSCLLCPQPSACAVSVPQFPQVVTWTGTLPCSPVRPSVLGVGV